MSLTPLDVGVQRFLEFTVTLVFPEVYSTGQLDAATQALLSEWPTLGSRLNSLRTDLIPSEPDNPPNIYRGNFVDKSLEDVIDISKPKQAGDDIKKLDKLFKFSNSLKKALRGQVFQVRALLLQNATVIRFVFQHPLCDATGGYTIVEAYCNILSGNKVPDVSFMRTPLRLYDGTTQEATNEKNTQTTAEVINRTHELFTWSWRALLKKGVKLAARDVLHPKRVDNTLYIPGKQIRVWKEEAQRQNISVTDHDLLTAFIYQSAYEQSLPQDYSMIFGIRRQLQNQTPMHNSCLVLPINIDCLHDSNQSNPAALPKIAAEVRRTIHQGRQPECLSKLLQFHANPSTQPMIPRWIGRKACQVSVTSWTDLPFFDLDTRGTTPSFVFGELDLWGLLKMFGLSMDDIIITWKGQAAEEDGHGGYWIRGRLNKAVWERMAEAIGK